MTAINPWYAQNSSYQAQPVDKQKDNFSQQDFDQKVLGYVKEHRPIEDLDGLLNNLKQLVPNHVSTLNELMVALNYADGQLRASTTDPRDTFYVHNYLDKLATQVTGVNFFYNQFLNDVLFPEDDDPAAKLEEW